MSDESHFVFFLLGNGLEGDVMDSGASLGELLLSRRLNMKQTTHEDEHKDKPHLLPWDKGTRPSSECPHKSQRLRPWVGLSLSSTLLPKEQFPRRGILKKSRSFGAAAGAHPITCLLLLHRPAASNRDYKK